MKEVEIKFQHKNGDVFNTKTVSIDNENNKVKVIVEIDTINNGRHVTMKEMHNIREYVINAINNNDKVICVPSFVKIRTLNIDSSFDCNEFIKTLENYNFADILKLVHVESK